MKTPRLCPIPGKIGTGTVVRARVLVLRSPGNTHVEPLAKAFKF